MLFLSNKLHDFFGVLKHWGKAPDAGHREHGFFHPLFPIDCRDFLAKVSA